MESEKSAASGYTLAELLVAMAVAGLLMAGVFGVYQASQQSYGAATAGEEALLVARAAIDRMTSDIKMIGGGWSKPSGAILAASPTHISFLADVNADTLDSKGEDARLEVDAPPGATLVRVSSSQGFSAKKPGDPNGEFLQISDGAVSENRLVTQVAGRLLTLGSGLSTSYPARSLVRSIETVSYALDGAGTLRRTVGGSGAQPLASRVRSLHLTYWDEKDPPAEILPVSQSDRDRVRRVTIKLVILVSSSGSSTVRTIESSAYLRNIY